MTCLALRPLLDTAFFPYYLAGLSAPVLTLDVARSALPVRSLGWVTWLTGLSLLATTETRQRPVLNALGFFLPCLAAMVAAMKRALQRTDESPCAGPTASG